jgi:endonuclease/exonuclease/phosphatase family metal-dependent hydrolase
VTTPTGERFRIATYNVLDPGFSTLAPWDERRNNVAETIATSRPTIVALQEAGWSQVGEGLTLAQDIAGLTALTLSKSSFSGDAFLFDGRVWSEGEGGHFLLPRGRGDRRRSAIWQFFHHTASGRTYLVVATHLSHGPERARARVRQTRHLVRRARAINRRRVPVIVLGDFNSWPGRSSTTPLDVLAAAGFHVLSPEARRSLDHIAVSPTLRATDFGVAEPELSGPASDHRLVWADIDVAS